MTRKNRAKIIYGIIYMNLSDNTKIHGLVSGILRGQNERVDELNERILGRFESDQPLQPNFSVRPVSTKYSHFPIVEGRKKTNVPIIKTPEYSTQTTFAPITSNGPVCGYLGNVNVESELRNQNHAIQNGASQGVFVPCSQSDLYKTVLPVPSKPVVQPHSGLFTPSPTCYTSMPSLGSHVGSQQFFNNTRTQMRGGELV